MDPSHHERVRGLFARAVPLSPAERARLLEETCGDEPEIRREVESLLEHHFAESIVNVGREPADIPSDIGFTRTESSLHLFLQPLYRRVAIVASLLGLVLLGWWTLNRVESALLRMRAGELETILASKGAALETWVREEKAHLRILARQPELRRPALELLRIAEAGNASIPALESSPERQELIEYVTPYKEDLGYSALEIYNARGFQVFATFRKPHAGDQLNENGLAVLARVLAGETVFEKPYRPETMFADSVSGTMYTVIGAPIRGDDGRVEGALAATQPAYRAFSDIVAGRLGETGEIYAFDQRAVMLTPSPFTEELREVGLLPAPEKSTRAWDSNTQLNLRLRDPGRLLSADAPAPNDGSSLPLTRLASTALARGPEDDATTALLEPYRNYRGARVIGAWRWLPEYNLVLAAEMEAVEAFAPLRYLYRTFGILFGLLALSVCVGLLASFKAARLRGRLRKLKQLGQYRLLELIGVGGMGKVYLAEHAALKRRTAVKILVPEFHSAEAIARFEREVVVSSQLTHPNTIEIYDYGRTGDGVFYYAMEYVDGLSLAELVSRFGPLPAGRVVHLLEQICRSLEEAHGQGIVHRDIKPLNVMVCCRGGICDVIKVLDFGLAKLEENGSTEALTNPTRVGGTLMYMAPERFTSPREVDARADIYSLGGVAYYLLTAKPPFQSVHDLDLMHQIGNAAPKRPTELVDVPLHPELERLVMECLEKSPDQRPSSVAVVARRLNAIRSRIGWSDAEAAKWWREHEATPASA